MEAGRQPGQPGNKIRRKWRQTGSQACQAKGKVGNGIRQAATSARQKDKQGMEADRQPGQPGKRISREWKQTSSQASRAKG